MSGIFWMFAMSSNWMDHSARWVAKDPITAAHVASNRSSGVAPGSPSEARMRPRSSPHSSIACWSAALSSASLDP